MRRVITVVVVNRVLAVVSGHGSRDLLTTVRGRTPMWSSRPRGWVTQPSTVPDLTAVAERQGYDVRVESMEAAS